MVRGLDKPERMFDKFREILVFRSELLISCPWWLWSIMVAGSISAGGLGVGPGTVPIQHRHDSKPEKLQLKTTDEQYGDK